MVSCSACGCSKTAKNNDLKITFHRFPRDESIRRQWVNIVDKDNWSPGKNSFLCSKHFTEKAFDRSSLLIVRLLPNAVPTVKITRMKYVRTNYPYAEELINVSNETPLSISKKCSVSEKNVTSSKESVKNTPEIFCKQKLKRLLHKLEVEHLIKNAKLRRLQKTICRQRKVINSLKMELKRKTSIKKEDMDII